MITLLGILFWLALGTGYAKVMLDAEVHPALAAICVAYATLFVVAYRDTPERRM